MMDTGVQFRFHDNLFNGTQKKRKNKKDKRNIKRSYNEEMPSKIVDTGFHFKFNDDFFAAFEKVEKSKKEKKMQKN
jgi:hypothetical protein